MLMKEIVEVGPYDLEVFAARKRGPDGKLESLFIPFEWPEEERKVVWVPDKKRWQRQIDEMTDRLKKGLYGYWTRYGFHVFDGVNSAVFWKCINVKETIEIWQYWIPAETIVLANYEWGYGFPAYCSPVLVVGKRVELEAVST